MPNIGELLKQEIRRLSRKELKAAYPNLQKDLVSLKRLVGKLGKRIDAIEKVVVEHNAFVKSRQRESLVSPGKEGKASRMSPKLITKLRKRLKLPRNDFGKLAGVSSNTIYLWETGKSSPSKKAKATLVGLRKLGVRHARKLLDD